MLLFRNPVSVNQPFSTTEDSSILKKLLKTFVSVTLATVFEEEPVMCSPTLNGFVEVTLRNPVLGFQELTTPDEDGETTVSPLLKSVVLNETSNIGKCFDGIILPTEFSASYVPGISPLARYSVRLYVTEPFPPPIFGSV